METFTHEQATIIVLASQHDGNIFSGIPIDVVKIILSFIRIKLKEYINYIRIKHWGCITTFNELNREFRRKIKFKKSIMKKLYMSGNELNQSIYLKEQGKRASLFDEWTPAGITCRFTPNILVYEDGHTRHLNFSDVGRYQFYSPPSSIHYHERAFQIPIARMLNQYEFNEEMKLSPSNLKIYGLDIDTLKRTHTGLTIHREIDMPRWSQMRLFSVIRGYLYQWNVDMWIPVYSNKQRVLIPSGLDIF